MLCLIGSSISSMIVIFFLVFLNTVECYSYFTFKNEFKYQDSINYKVSRQSNIHDFLTKNNFFYLKLNGEFYPLTSPSWYDGAYIDKRFKKMILYKSNLKVNSPIKMGEYYSINNVNGAVHLQAENGKIDLYHLYNFTTNETYDFTKLLKGGKIKSQKKEALINLFYLNLIPQANAQVKDSREYSDSMLRCPELIEKKEALVQSNTTRKSIDIANIGYACIEGAAGGLWNMSGGVVVKVVDGIKTAFVDPQSLIMAPVELFRTLVFGPYFFLTTLGDLGQEVLKLPGDVITKILCEAVSTIGMGMIYTILSSGYATGAVIIQIASIFEKYGKILNNSKVQAIAERIKKKGSSIKGNSATGKFQASIVQSDKLAVERASTMDWLRSNTPGSLNHSNSFGHQETTNFYRAYHAQIGLHNALDVAKKSSSHFNSMTTTAVTGYSMTALSLCLTEEQIQNHMYELKNVTPQDSITAPGEEHSR